MLWFAALRALVAGAALLAVAGTQRRPAPGNARGWGLVVVLGLVNVTVGFGAMFAGVAGLATGTAAVLSNAQPLLILLPAWWWYGEAVSARTAIALVVGFSGLLVVAAGWHLLVGGGALVVLAAAVEGAPVIAWTPRFIATLAFLSLVGTAATTVAWFVEVGRSRLDILSAWTFLTPVFGIILAAVVLGQVPSGWTAAGLGAVLGSMWMVLRPQRSAPPTMHEVSTADRTGTAATMYPQHSPHIPTGQLRALPRGARLLSVTAKGTHHD